VPARCTKRVKEIGSIIEHFKALPEYRGRIESYPQTSVKAPFGSGDNRNLNTRFLGQVQP
jgi:hypothetical protein